MKYKIKRIKPPKFKLGRYILNEYELRNLMLEVAKGSAPKNLKVKDKNGLEAEILENGRLSVSLEGLQINSELTLGVLRLNR
jgi:hypothetical protein